MSKTTIVSAIACLSIVASSARAATAEVEANITRALTTVDEKYGGCMVHLDASISGEGLDCLSNWVTFSCSGEHTSRSAASRLFDSALMAFVMDLPVKMRIDDTKKHGGHCFAYRVDVLPPRDDTPQPAAVSAP